MKLLQVVLNNHPRLLVPESLVPTATLSLLGAWQSPWKSAFDSGYLECRLGPGDERVDFMASLKLGEARRLAAGRALSGKEWPRSEGFLGRWAGSDGILSSQIPHVWLAFDLEPGLERMPEPQILICLDPDFARRAEDPAYRHRLSPERFESSVAAIFACFPGLPPAGESAANACFRDLPPDGEILHLSIMSGRNPPAVKANLCMPASSLPGWIRRAGWNEGETGLRRIMDILPEAPERVKLQVTLGPSASPKLELETRHFRSSRADAALALSLELACAHGLCTPSKGRSLATWPGMDRMAIPGADFPLRIQKWLDLKYIAGPGDALELKAYLGIKPMGFLL